MFKFLTKEAVTNQISFRNLKMHERLQIDRYWFGDSENDVKKKEIDELLNLRNNIVREKFVNRKRD